VGRQPVNRLLVLAVAASGCAVDPPLTPVFHGPEWIDVLDPAEGGPFWSPVAFVVNTRGGTITPVDVRHGTAVSDQHGAPFLPPRRVATGDARQLGQVVVWADPESAEVRLLAADLAYGVLVEAPYVRGLGEDGAPLPIEPTATDPVATAADGGASGARVSGLQLRYGHTTTEDWEFTFDGAAWTAVGSRSGRHTAEAVPGKPWTSDNRELELVLTGTAAAGDTVRLRTDTELVEHDLGGMVLGLERVPGEDLAVIGVWDPAAEQGDLVLWDLRAAEELGRVGLADRITASGLPGAGAQPWRFAFGDPEVDDGAPPALYVADARLPLVWRVDLDLEAPADSAVSSLSTPGPVAALAALGRAPDPEVGVAGYHRLFVAPVDDTRVDVYDLQAERWVDVNPRDPGAGLDLNSPVVGLSPAPLPIRLIEESNHGARREDKVVAVTTFDGKLRLLQGEDGCLAIDGQGARIAYDTGALQVEFVDRGAPSNPVLFTDPDTARAVVGSQCGGIARDETWTLTYDGVAGAWQVEGSVSGPQLGFAREDERYTTDDGGISFLILAGTRPSTDGDSFVFILDDGVLELSSVPDASGQFVVPFDLPGPPRVFTMDAGPSGGGWDVDRTQVHALVPVTNSDMVVRVRLQGWSVEFVID